MEKRQSCPGLSHSVDRVDSRGDSHSFVCFTRTAAADSVVFFRFLSLLSNDSQNAPFLYKEVDWA